MKRIFYLVVVLFMALTVNASDFKFDWGHMYDGKGAGDTPIAMSKATDGNYYCLLAWCADAGEKSLFYDGEKLTDTKGEVIEGADGTVGNMVLQKLNAETGKPLWTIYSNSGYVYQTSCNVKATSDGGAIALFMVRNWSNPSVVMNVVDAAGAQHSVTWENNGHNVYFPIAMKVDADGNVKWMKQLFTFTYVDGLKYFPCNLYYSNDMELDENDNIYIGGSFYSTINFKKANGEEEHITAKNVVNWDGDVQAVNGDLYLAKFDKDGNYIQNLTAEGTAVAANIAKMEIHNGVIYAEGRIRGDGTEMSLGGKAFTPATSQSIFFTSINANDFSVNYARMFNSAVPDSKEGVHPKAIQYLNDNVYLIGSVQSGSFLDGDNTLFPLSAGGYTGVMIKCEPATGNLIAAGMYKEAISEAFGVVETKDTLANNEVVDSVLLYGYNMFNGYFMASFSQEGKFFIQNGEKILINYGTVASSAPLLVDGKSVIMLNRGGRNGTSGLLAHFYGTDYTLANLHGWSVLVSKFTNNSIYTKTGDVAGIDAVENADNKLHNYNVYNFNGTLVKKANSMDNAVEGLSKGFYIIGNKKIIVK